MTTPFASGSPLREELAGSYSARRGDHRVIHLIVDGRLVIEIVTVAHRRDAYRT